MSRMISALRNGRVLLRMRSGSRPVGCPFLPTVARFAHSTTDTKGKSVQYGATGQATADEISSGSFHKTLEERLKQAMESPDTGEKPLTEEEINDPEMIPVSIYEEDPNSPTGERLVKHLRTPEELRKHNEIYKLMKKVDENPNYQEDNPELNRHLIEELIQDPYFADLTEDLEDIKKNFIMTKGEEEKMLAQAEADEEAKEAKLRDNFKSMLQMASFSFVDEFINDPDYAYAQDELYELQDALPAFGGDISDFDAAVEKVLKKLAEDPNFTEKMAAREARGADPKDLAEQAMADKKWQEMEEAEERDMTKLLGMMKDLMGTLGHDETLNKLESEMEAAWNGELDEEALEEQRAQEMSFTELGKELMKFATSNPKGGTMDFTDKDDADSKPVDPAIEAKVDEIMKDPRLMEKLMYIQKIVNEEKQKQERMNIPVELAPDPIGLESDRTTTLKHRMQLARNDPEHSAALQALCVRLPQPFNVSPALRLFNDAIQFAYVGANDDVRRILWRAYFKARSLPSFLQNLSDDAWDLLYYSQAVTWHGNLNREAHLRLLLQDLESVGKDGPPTHPDTIAAMQQQE